MRAVQEIPPDYLALYEQAAASCPGLDWTVLAGIGKLESDHGQSTLPGVRSGASPSGAKLSLGAAGGEAREFWWRHATCQTDIRKV